MSTLYLSNLELRTAWDRPAYYRHCLKARRLYAAWRNSLADMSHQFVHPLWLDVQPVFAEMVRGGLPLNFLHYPVVQGMFFRTGFDLPQQYELEYLRRSNHDIWRRCQRYRESMVGDPVLDCIDLGISANSLGMLYYFARIMEHLDRTMPVHSIVEFGGGYGSLCRVFSELLDRAPTYVIIDLPEMLALQYVFLRANSYAVTAHTKGPIKLKTGRVNLVPVSSIESLDLEPDLFVSTFGLSESTNHVQDIVTQRRFFNAKAAYVVGQNHNAQAWKNVCLEPPDTIHTAMHAVFQHTKVEAFHFADAWEVIALNNRDAMNAGPFHQS
jgi:hypothetical protein